MPRKIVVTVDQSGKVEEYSRDTAIAYSHPYEDTEMAKKSLLIPSKQKKALADKGISKCGGKKPFHLKLFSAGLFLLVKDDTRSLKEVIVDLEYPGRDNDIVQHLSNFYSHHSEHRLDAMPHFRFDTVQEPYGETSHNLAYRTYKGERKPDIESDLDLLKDLVFPSRK